MAVRKLDNRTMDEKQEAELRRAVVDELRRPEDAATPAGAPVIYLEESGLPNNYTHWYAVWDRFAGIDGEARSRIVLGAVREALGSKEALRVAVAMGLTPAEAEAMGVGEWPADAPSAVQQRDAA